MSKHDDRDPCGCSSERVNALLCQLFDGMVNGTLSAVEEQQLRGEIAACEQCYRRLNQEAQMRALLSRCCGAVEETPEVQAPEGLSERIMISIRRTRIRFHE